MYVFTHGYAWLRMVGYWPQPPREIGKFSFHGGWVGACLRIVMYGWLLVTATTEDCAPEDVEYFIHGVGTGGVIFEYFM